MADDNRKVAVLEGTAEFRKALEKGFGGLGITVHAAGTWDEAIGLMADLGSTIAVAILDTDLPGRPCQGIVENLPLLPNGRWPVFLTTEREPDPEEVAEAHRRGIIGYLHKPADLDENLFRVEAYLEDRLAQSDMCAPRTPAVATVRLEPRSAHHGEPRIALVRNISRTGMRVSTISAPPVSATVTLTFRLPYRTAPVQCAGRVVWLKAHDDLNGRMDAGIEFEDLQPDDLEHLHRYVLGKLRESSGPIR